MEGGNWGAAFISRVGQEMYPVLFFDALRVKIREDAVVKSTQLTGQASAPRWSHGKCMT